MTTDGLHKAGQVQTAIMIGEYHILIPVRANYIIHEYRNSIGSHEGLYTYTGYIIYRRFFSPKD